MFWDGLGVGMLEKERVWLWYQVKERRVSARAGGEQAYGTALALGYAVATSVAAQAVARAERKMRRCMSSAFRLVQRSDGPRVVFIKVCVMRVEGGWASLIVGCLRARISDSFGEETRYKKPFSPLILSNASRTKFKALKPSSALKAWTTRLWFPCSQPTERRSSHECRQGTQHVALGQKRQAPQRLPWLAKHNNPSIMSCQLRREVYPT